MKLSRVLLLLVVSTLAVTTADARKETSSLTLSPTSESLISTRTSSDDTSTSTTSASTASATGTAVSATAAPTSSDSDSSSDEDTSTTKTPSSTSATSTDDEMEPETTDESETTAPATTAPASASSADEQETTAPSTSTANSESGTATVDSLNSNQGISGSSQDGMGLSTILPVVFGALACVGALVMAVTYKKKHSAHENDGQRPSSDFQYSDGEKFTPDNRSLAGKDLDDRPPSLAAASAASSAAAVAVVSSSNGDLTADFTSGFADTTSQRSMQSSSPFASSRCEARVSSPVDDRYACGGSEMEFSASGVRDQEGSNVVLTIEELQSSSCRATPQVQL